MVRLNHSHISYFINITIVTVHNQSMKSHSSEQLQTIIHQNVLFDTLVLYFYYNNVSFYSVDIIP